MGGVSDLICVSPPPRGRLVSFEKTSDQSDLSEPPVNPLERSSVALWGAAPLRSRVEISDIFRYIPKNILNIFI